MLRTPLPAIPEPLPPSIAQILSGGTFFDSSCSESARVYYVETDHPCFLKSAPCGILREEAALTRYFHTLGLAPGVIAFESAQRDYLLTARVPGEDCIHPMYLENPARLCDTLAAVLRRVHDTPAIHCPVTRSVPRLPDWTPDEIHLHYNSRRFLGSRPFPDAESAWDLLKSLAPSLQSDTLIHGDYCLPNVMLQDWRFSGLIDVGGGGLGNRYADLFWGLWSLCYNLKTNQYTDRFLDAYGRDRFDRDLLRATAALEGFGIE